MNAVISMNLSLVWLRINTNGQHSERRLHLVTYFKAERALNCFFACLTDPQLIQVQLRFCSKSSPFKGQLEPNDDFCE